MTRITLPLAALLASSFAMSCEDENETRSSIQPGSAQFEKSEMSLSENSEKTTVTIAFNKQADDDGEVYVKVSSSNVQMFQFEPAVTDDLIKVRYLKGQSKISFEVTPIDNEIVDGDKTLDFTIVSVSSGFYIGASRNLATKWVDDETAATVDFEAQESLAKENSNSAFPIRILFSHVTKEPGVVRVSLRSAEGVYGTHFTTEPAPSHGIITLPVESGTDHVVFKVFPVDDQLYNQQRSITYTIADAEGALEKGENIQHELILTDDELEGAAKEYEISGGGWRHKKRYEYNENGTISKMYWDKYTPGHSEGMHSYVYNASGMLEKIVESSAREKIFLREGNRIVRSEEYADNVLKKYTLYGYDAAGNVGEAAVHYRQPDGSIILSTLFVYLYHTDHNIYKILTYAIPEGSDELVHVGTQTFDHYLDVENQFPMVDILPDQKAQNKLPASYRLEGNGEDITYQLTYQFNNDGRPISRTATSSGAAETVTYAYY